MLNYLNVKIDMIARAYVVVMLLKMNVVNVMVMELLMAHVTVMAM